MNLPAGLGAFVGLEQLALRAYLLVMAAQLLRLGLTPLRVPRAARPPASWPSLTLQLPVRDEGEVGRRVIRMAAALDYPRDRLELQVLDDSEPGSASAHAVEEAVDEARRGGVEVALLRRPTRDGGKAGNLQHGLGLARGELLVILDADTIAPPGFLRGLVAALEEDGRAVMAQGAQRFDNADHGPLQRSQALMVEGLVQVEQAIRSARGQPLHFNGTGGVWRREVVEALGGWRGVCEDFDLSLRAWLAGHRMLHRVDLPFRSELAWTMADLRRQQRRWTAGKAAAVREALPRMLDGTHPPALVLEMLAPLVSRLLHAFVVLLVLTMPLTALGWLEVPGPGREVDLALLALVFGGGALHLRRTGRAGLPGALVAAAAMLVGVSFVCTRGLVEGLLGRELTFERTPKGGARGRGDPSGWVETAAGAVCLLTAPAAWGRGDPGGAAGLLALAASLLWVGLGARWWEGPARG